MAGQGRCSIIILSSLILVTLFPLSRTTLISKRHSIHLSVNEPDDPIFSLTNLARVAKAQLEGSRFGSRRDIQNPYEIVQICDEDAQFRKINGTCNNLGTPLQGAAKTPLERLTRNRYEDRVSTPTRTFFRSRGELPSARRVSVVVHETTSNISSRHSHMMMNFGQFTDHDITLSPETNAEGGEEESPKDVCCEPNGPEASTLDLSECFVIPTPNDPVLTETCMPFVRSAITPRLRSSPAVRFQLNDLTAYVDASQVYGVTNRRARSLRSFVDGRLRISRGVNGEERLPTRRDNPPNCLSNPTNECRFAGGDSRTSEQAGLTSVHTLMLRNHNRIAGILKRLNRRWSDEQLYQTTRRIMGAIMQRIIYNEYLPELLGPVIMDKYDLPLTNTQKFFGYSPNEDATIVTEFSTAAFRFGHSTIRQTFGTFTRQLDLKDIFDSFRTVDRYGNDALLHGLSTDDMEERDRFFSRGIRDDLLGIMLDLPAFNIQRGRDHGLASYNDIRRFFRLRVYRTYAEMVGRTHSQSTVDSLRKVYPTPDDIEMFPGGVSELHLNNAIVGETFAHIIGIQFRRIKFGDRFWHETVDKTTQFANDQLDEIRKVSLAGLFCQNVPGTRVRRFLLISDIPGNPSVSCSNIPKMDFTPWRENGY